jgi:non-canonical (house-cleaning) NTP pyrophosphatase
MVFGRTNSKQNAGAVGILTGDRISRTDIIAPACVLACVPLLNRNFQF